MIKIYHNNRCSKSRCALQYLQELGSDFEVIHYLENTPSKTELRELIDMLGIKSVDLVRKGESLYKEHYKNQELSDTEWIDVLHANPILIERPIVFTEKKAVIGRPPELVKELLA